jgi:uncharacterized membrane protein
MSPFLSFHPNFYLAFEILGTVSFLVIVGREIVARHRRRVFEIISCAIFGVILEIGDTYLAHTYSYSSNFLIEIMHVPLVIGAGWATIVYCAMLLSDEYNVPWQLRPFLDALTALMIDLSMDAVAIRLGFWHWSIPLTQEWYGVPFENLAGWIFVVFSFSFLMRFLRTLNTKRLWTKVLMALSPIIAYLALVAEITIFSLVAILPYEINHWTTLLTFNYHPDFAVLYDPQVQMWKLIVLVVLIVEMVQVSVWAVLKYGKKDEWRFDALSFSVLAAMHLFFIIALFMSGIYRELPILAVIGIGLFLLYCLLHLLPHFIKHTPTYFFREVKEAVAVHSDRAGRIVETIFK